MANEKSANQIQAKGKTGQNEKQIETSARCVYYNRKNSSDVN